MQTTISRRGQTVVPAAIRKRHHLLDGDRLAWIDNGESIRIVPIPAEPVRALKGIAKEERLVQELLKYRREERTRER